MSTRTIRRDLDALQAAGFSLYDVPSDSGGPSHWRVSSPPLKRLGGTSFTLSELCAFYINRTRLAATGATPIDASLKSAIDKVEKALSPHMKTYLGRLEEVLTYKPGPAPVGQAAFAETLTRATVDRRRVEMDYDSVASRRVKRYTVEPHRLTFTNGGLYLYAFVPAYRQMRTFALQRIRQVKVLEATFTPGQIPKDPYTDSIGPFSGGTPREVEILFQPNAAPYIEERQIHPTQQITRHEDGTLTLRMKVAIDPPLRCWILGYGHDARVVRPSSLAGEILEEIEEAREQYVPPIPFEAPPPSDLRATLHLPFGSGLSPQRTAERSPSRSGSRQ